MRPGVVLDALQDDRLTTASDAPPVTSRQINRGRVRVKFDEGWLRSQYLYERRTLPDIAAELGMSPTNLGRIARQYQIPLRP